MTYLRAPAATTDGSNTPGALPSVLRVFTPRACTRARLEAIIELRDEAAYLGLNDLVDLCTSELTIASTIIASSSSPSTPEMERQSLHSTHTLIEPDERQGVAMSLAGDLAPGPSAKGFNLYTTAKEVDAYLLPPIVDLHPDSEKEAERAQAALRIRRLNASASGSNSYKDVSSGSETAREPRSQLAPLRPAFQQSQRTQSQSQFRFPASPSLSPRTHSHSQSDAVASMFTRQAKSVSPSRGRRAGPPIAVKPSGGDYF